jgi:hypothetical protein
MLPPAALVGVLNAWNAAHGLEHHPRFFDWEKDAWVPLSRWHGARAVAPTQPAAPVAADSE